MIVLNQAGPGLVAATKDLYDSTGTGLLPVQAEVTGTVTFQLVGRVDPAMPWRVLRAAAAASFLESMAWVPWIALEILSGSGSVRLAIGEK